jgi:hypothetical protein
MAGVMSGRLVVRVLGALVEQSFGLCPDNEPIDLLFKFSRMKTKIAVSLHNAIIDSNLK